jgi:hypothetical protein
VDWWFDLVEETCGDHLPGARRPPATEMGVVTSSRPSLGVGRPDPVGDEVEGGSKLHRDWVV